MKKLLSLMLCVVILVTTSLVPVMAATVDSTEMGGYAVVKDFFALNKSANWNNWMSRTQDGTAVNGNRVVETDAKTGFEYGSIEFSQSGIFGIKIQEGIALNDYIDNGYVLVTMRVKTNTTKPEIINIRTGNYNQYYTQELINYADKVKIGEWSTIMVPFKTLIGTRTQNKLGKLDNSSYWQLATSANINDIKIVANNSEAPETKSVLEVAELKIYKDETLYTWGESIMDGRVVNNSTVAIEPNSTAHTLTNMNGLAVSSKSKTYNEEGYLTFEPYTEESTSMGFGVILHKELPAEGDIANELFIRIKFRTENVPSNIKMNWSVRGDYNFKNAQNIPTTFTRTATNCTWSDYGDGWMTVDVKVPTIKPNWWWTGIPTKKIGSIVFSFEGYDENTYATAIDVKEVAVYGPKQEFIVKDFKVVNEGATEDISATSYLAGENLQIKATVKSTMPETQNMNIIAALYNDDGMLLDATPISLTANANPNDQVVGDTYTVAENIENTKIKAFLWDDLLNITPLYNAIDELTQETSSEA